jgi:hypothetical protein
MKGVDNMGIINPISILTETNNTSRNIDLDVCLNSVAEHGELNYVEETLTFLIDLNEDCTNYNKKFYKSILESDGDTSAIQESFSELFSDIGHAIDKFLNYLKHLMKKFLMHVHQIFAKDSTYILKYSRGLEDKVDELSSGEQPELEGYNFTIDNNIPYTSMLTDLVNMDPANIGSNYKELKSQCESGLLDELRAETLFSGKDTYIKTIPEENYTNYCFASFRDGTEDTSAISVNSKYIKDAKEHIKNYKADVDKTEQLRDRINSNYNEFRDQLNKAIKATSFPSSNSTHIVGDRRVSSDVMVTADKYMKLTSDILTEMMNMHGIAFSSKLQAIKDRHAQDVNAINMAMNATKFY